MAFLLVVGLCLQVLAPYAIWFDRRNLVAHQAVGFTVIAYIIPGFFTNYETNFSSEQVYFYTLTSFVGGISYLVGMLLSSAYSTRKRWIFKTIETLQSKRFRSDLGRKISLLLMISIACLVIGYLIMGFIPMFADDPLAAKQFKGAYRDRYLPAAWIFRPGLIMAGLIMPVAIMYALQVRRRLFFVAVGILASLILVSLAKGAAAIWLLLVLGVLAAKTRKRTLAYVALGIGINIAGAAFYFILAQLTGIDAFSSGGETNGFAQLVAAGAPDLVDQLKLINAFQNNGNPFTWGRTFLGGMVPFSYAWNPAVWTLDQLNGGQDVSEIISGGLRLPASLWGYVSFGWPGVIIVPAVSGFILGCFIRMAQKILQHTKDNLTLMIVMVALLTVGVPLSSFYALAMYMIPSIVLIWYFFRGQQRKKVSRFPVENATAASVKSVV